MSLSSYDTALTNSGADCAGQAVAAGGDLDGDGHQDMVIAGYGGQTLADGDGLRAYAVYGPVSGSNVRSGRRRPNRIPCL